MPETWFTSYTQTNTNVSSTPKFKVLGVSKKQASNDSGPTWSVQILMCKYDRQFNQTNAGQKGKTSTTLSLNPWMKREHLSAVIMHPTRDDVVTLKLYNISSYSLLTSTVSDSDLLSMTLLPSFCSRTWKSTRITEYMGILRSLYLGPSSSPWLYYLLETKIICSGNFNYSVWHTCKHDIHHSIS